MPACTDRCMHARTHAHTHQKHMLYWWWVGTMRRKWRYAKEKRRVFSFDLREWRWMLDTERERERKRVQIQCIERIFSCGSLVVFCLQVFQEAAQHYLRVHPIPRLPVLHVWISRPSYLPQVGQLRCLHVTESTESADWLVLLSCVYFMLIG